MSGAVPVEIRLVDAGKALELVYESGETYALTAEFLRVHTPSAEARGHHGQGGKTVYGKRDVRISGLEPVGNYALRPKFDDGHSTGIYTWDFLRDLGVNQAAHWQAYLDRLAAEGFSRG